MKRQLLAVAIAAATLLPLTAQAAPTVYGRLNLRNHFLLTIMQYCLKK